MMGFFHAAGRTGDAGRGPRWSDSLRGRRLIAACRRWATALAAGLAVFAALQCVLSCVRTRTVVVAARDLDRGRVVSDGDVAVREVPAAPEWDAAFRSADAVTGLVMQVDAAEGTPLFPAMARDSPTVPPGAAVVEVRLAGDAGRLVPGDEVALMTGGCTPETGSADDAAGVTESNGPTGLTGPTESTGPTEPTSPTEPTGSTELAESTGPTTASPDETVPGTVRACMLAADAIVMERARTDDTGVAVVPFAIPADEAVRVMAVQEHGMILAVEPVR